MKQHINTVDRVTVKAPNRAAVPVLMPAALPDAVQGFLKQFSPFKALPPAAMAYLLSHLRLSMVPSGAEIIGPDMGIARELFILERGKVQARQVGEMAATEYTQRRLSPGDCFPIGALIAGRPSTNRYTAMSNVFVYRLAAEHFHHLMEISVELNVFCTRYIAGLLSQSRFQLQMLFSQRASEQQSLNTPLFALANLRSIVTVTPETPLSIALASLSQAKAALLVAQNSDRQPVGVLSHSDVLDRVVLPGLSLDHPVSQVMTPDPICLQSTESAYDAVLVLGRHDIDQLLVVNSEGVLVGGVNERDVFNLQRVGLRQIRASIEAADAIEGLQHAVTDIRQLAFNMLAQGVGSEPLTRFISVLNDALTRRIIEINLSHFALVGLDWCWLAFGSEGRDEQTFSTDQDNGIVFICSDVSICEEMRSRLLEFARKVNHDLDQCGFPLCQGNIMASNPAWCLTLEEWMAQFSDWIRVPVPEALLNACIFFDFRPLYGDVLLAEKLRHYLLDMASQNPAFLRAMVSNALQVQPPLGKIRDFVSGLEESDSSALDLKKYGARLFVDAARIYALASGVECSNTLERLRTAGARRSMNTKEIDAYIEALNFIQLLRLRHQKLDDQPGKQGNNLIYPDSLNALERTILKEAFKQAKKLQQRLRLDYQTN